ncbi:hypothetical protein SADUNF_Sadunf17G0098700 [Salix dunnii]|uniref:1-phosphatidylinositol 4-kinase n=1 Tax=Salix dunnii TaxID=1413687 RepID=A0A835J6E5_9ROSI|nr:hypothetical protein SADUNF_Sadunf17G0098700 [Salix dunnii]
MLGFSEHSAKVKQMLNGIVKAMRIGDDPIPIYSGLGGTYYFKNCHGENIAIVKPTDEEPYSPNNPKDFVGKAPGQPGLKRSVRIGETGFRGDAFLEESAEEEGEADIEEELNLSRDEYAGCTENKITWLVLLPEVGVLMSSFLQAGKDRGLELPASFEK